MKKRLIWMLVLFLLVLFLIALQVVNALDVSNTSFHYKMDNDTIKGTLVYDTLGLNNATISGTPYVNQTGFIKNSVNFTTGKAISANAINGNAFSCMGVINMNVNGGTNGNVLMSLEGTNAAQDFDLGIGYGSGADRKMFAVFQSSGGDYGNKYVNSQLKNNTWYTLAWTRSTTNMIFYIDGVRQVLVNSTTGNPLLATYNNVVTVGDRYAITTYNFKGLVDEAMCMNRQLNDSEILEWNASVASGNSYPFSNSLISINLTAPANNAVFNNSITETPMNFSVNATGTGPVNCSITVNASTYLDPCGTNQANQSSCQVTWPTQARDWGWNTWNVTCCVGASSQCTSPTLKTTSVNYKFYVNDTIKPSLMVQYPVNLSILTNLSLSYSLNYTASDARRDKCWYQNVTGGILALASCANSTFKIINASWQNITVYVNDTFNNINSSQIFFNYSEASGWSHKIDGVQGSAISKIVGVLRTAVAKVIGVV